MFVYRCFGLVDDTRLVQVAALDRMVSATQHFMSHESIMGLGLAGCVQIVLGQCSPQLFNVSLDYCMMNGTNNTKHGGL